MPINDNVEQEIVKSLEEVRLDPKHQLSPARRLAIYQALWPSLDLEEKYHHAFVTALYPVVSIEHQRYGYLGILTAQRVLPLWDRSLKLTTEDLPRRMLSMAEGILNGTQSPSEAYGFYIGDFYYLMDTIAFETTYKAWRVAGAAYQALGMCLGAPPFCNLMNLRQNFYVLFPRDAAHDAVIAYSVISDDDEPGVWREAYFMKIQKKEWNFDLERQLEFWEWWLTEAVPTAWRMAEEQEDRIDPAL